VVLKRLSKVLLFILALAPAAWLVRGMMTGNLGVNPAETIQLQTGRWALKFLLITLAVTPVRRIFHWNVVIQYRRMLGLFAFFYASLHFASYIVLDQYFAFDAMVADIAKRPFITVGFAAFVLMLPLALTSTKGWIRRLGRRWQLLHRLVYVSAICAVVHFIWKVKLVIGDPVLYTGVLMVLLGFRVIRTVRSRMSSPPVRVRVSAAAPRTPDFHQTRTELPK
jgi:sulfoxide reductase heme-binding subunit YedZ